MTHKLLLQWGAPTTPCESRPCVWFDFIIIPEGNKWASRELKKYKNRKKQKIQTSISVAIVVI